MIADHGEAAKILTHTLGQSDDVQAIVGGRVFGSHLKDGEVESTLANGPILIVSIKAGGVTYAGTVSKTIFELWGFSMNSADEAARAYQAGYEALQACRVSCEGVNLYGLARETARPLIGEVAKYNSWFCRGRWIMTAA